MQTNGREERDRIADELRRAMHGEAWHGPSLRELLRCVTPEEAAARPVDGAHTIGELVLHLTAWTREAARRLRDGVAREPEDGDWPAVEDGEEAWVAALQRLDAAHDELLAAVTAFPAERLGEVVPAAPGAASAEVSYSALLHGVAQHHAYHGGQITLLRRAQGS